METINVIGGKYSMDSIKKNIGKIVVAALLVVSLLMNTYLFQKVNDLENNVSSSNNSSNTNTNAQVQNIVYDVTSATTDVVAQVSDSVVAIQVYVNGQLYSSGSGVIYEVDGNDVYVATNHHVIDGGSNINVIFSNGESVEVEVVGSDVYTDLALLKFTKDDSTKITAIKLGDSDLLQVGEEVLAIGSPLGIQYAGTTTKGIISGTERVVSVDVNNDGVEDWDMTVVQTDAAINAGNSGGALINMAGELVGITSMKLTGESVEGIGFAIPVNEIIDVLAELKSTGEVSRPILGISSISLDSISSYGRYVYRIDTTRTTGIYVQSVQDGSAAANAGLQVGDIIIGFDGNEITTYKEFLKALYSKSSGDKVTIKFERSGSTKEISVTLG